MFLIITGNENWAVLLQEFCQSFIKKINMENGYLDEMMGGFLMIKITWCVNYMNFFWKSAKYASNFIQCN
jgi:hypothetical protein